MRMTSASKFKALLSITLPVVSSVVLVASARGQIDPAVTDQPVQLPAVVLRPSVHQVDDCEVELDQPQGTDGFRLKINVPDSIATIEVAPSVNSSRSFRISMDGQASQESVADQQLAEQSDILADQVQEKLRSPMAIMSKAGWRTTGKVVQDNVTHEAPARSATTTEETPPARGFVDNPFFQPKNPPVKNELDVLAEQTPQEIERPEKSVPVTLDEITELQTSLVEPVPVTEMLPAVRTAEHTEQLERFGSITVDSNMIAAGAGDASLATYQSLPDVDENTLHDMPLETASPETTEITLKRPLDLVVDQSLGGVVQPELVVAESDLPSVPVEIMSTPPELPTENESPEPVTDATDVTDDAPVTESEEESTTVEELPVRVAVSGPESIPVGQTGDYSITVYNNSQTVLSELKLTLDLPASMDNLVIENSAEFDADNQRLVWSLPEVSAASQISFRYRVDGSAAGQSNHRVQLLQGEQSVIVEKTVTVSAP